MTSPADEIVSLVHEAARLARSGEALLNLATRLVDTANAIKHLQDVEGNNDLLPEIVKAFEHIQAASECVKSAASVVDARFANAMEL